MLLQVWLQGGPGGSSMFGLFSEMGPYALSQDLQLVPRNTTWNKDNAMIFIDNPVGAGFSFTDTADGYCNNTKSCVASNLHSLLQQFYELHDELQHVPLYVTGESYGGHYVPGLGAYIVTQNEANPQQKIPLAGIAVGDGWIAPSVQVAAYPEMMFGQGLISVAQKATIQKYCDDTVNLIQAGQMEAAFDVWGKLAAPL
eukprot:SAG25_NODE_1553_length_2774_cov_3.969720_2_plen_199_part_00